MRGGADALAGVRKPSAAGFQRPPGHAEPVHLDPVVANRGDAVIGPAGEVEFALHRVAAEAVTGVNDDRAHGRAAPRGASPRPARRRGRCRGTASGRGRARSAPAVGRSAANSAIIVCASGHEMSSTPSYRRDRFKAFEPLVVVFEHQDDRARSRFVGSWSGVEVKSDSVMLLLASIRRGEWRRGFLGCESRLRGSDDTSARMLP